MSINQEFEHWMKWNRCRDGIGFEDLKRDKIIEDTKRGKSVHVTCAEATPGDHGCDRMTSLCLHGDNTHHSQWSVDMPQTREVMLFFMKSLCLQQRGIFNAETLKCECDRESIFEGLFCITPKERTRVTLDGEDDGGSWSGFIAILVVSASAAVVFVVRRKRTGQINFTKYAKVKIDDDIESTEEFN